MKPKLTKLPVGGFVVKPNAIKLLAQHLRAENEMRLANEVQAQAAQLVELTLIIDNAARDIHGVFYDPQGTLQKIAAILGRPAPNGRLKTTSNASCERR